MTKTVKNIVMVVTLLCTIFLIIFCVELVLLNRDNDDDGTALVVSGDPAEENGENGDGSNLEEELSGNESPNNGGENGTADEVIIIPPPRDGTRFEFPMLGVDSTLAFYADETLFEFWEGEFDWLFVYAGGGRASLEIAFDFITPPGGISDLAGRFLYGYLDGGDSRVIGEGTIGNSDIIGYAVTGEHEEDGLIYEAWIHSLTGNPNEGLAVVFVMNYEVESQRAALLQIIDTLEMLTEEEPVEAPLEDEE